MNIDDEFYGYSGGEFSHDDNNAMENNEEDDQVAADQYRGDSTISTLNPKSVRERIDETLEVLSNLKARKNIKLSRSQLLETLSR
jgi:hypothetical protein